MRVDIHMLDSGAIGGEESWMSRLHAMQMYLSAGSPIYRHVQFSQSRSHILGLVREAESNKNN